MRNTWKLIYKGLILESSCKYLYIHQGDTQSLSENQGVLELIYKPSDDSETLGRLLGIPTIGAPIELGPGMQHPEKYKETLLTLNGVTFRKLTYDPHIVRIVIVGDNESRVCQEYNRTTIVVSEKDYQNKEFLEFLLYSGNLMYLIPNKEKGLGLWKLRNFPRISIKNKDLTLTSDSETVYFLRKSYDRYQIRSIDYQEQFIREISKILEDYGIELTRMNREETLSRRSYISYQFTSTPVKCLHPRGFEDDSSVLAHKLPVDFVLRCSDTVMFHDFKNKYNNIDLLTNFCEFKTTDKYGKRWSAAIKWGQISEDFNHIYQGDDNSNYSHQCQFRCELYFYEVYDKSLDFIEEIKIDINNEDMKIKIDKAGNIINNKK